MQPLKDASHLFEVERRVRYAERPGFRINELQISPSQQVPWHYHTNIRDTFYVLEGRIRIFLREPKEEVQLGPGDTFSVDPRRPPPRHQRRRPLGNIPDPPRRGRVRFRPHVATASRKSPDLRGSRDGASDDAALVRQLLPNPPLQLAVKLPLFGRSLARS